jgi:hypothetical protein
VGFLKQERVHLDPEPPGFWKHLRQHVGTGRLPHMVPGGWGRIVTLSSIAAVRGGRLVRHATAYAAAKATLIGLGGGDPQLAGHVRAAVRLGVPPVLLAELVIHCVQYVGFPRAINAMAVLRATLSECGVDVSLPDPPGPARA